MRRTLASLMPTAAAMVRVLQWVALAGFWRVVRVTTRFVSRVPILGLRPGRGASFCNPRHAQREEAFAPAGNLFRRDGHAGGNLLVLLAGGRKQHDASALCHPHWE